MYEGKDYRGMRKSAPGLKSQPFFYRGTLDKSGLPEDAIIGSINFKWYLKK